MGEDDQLGAMNLVGPQQVRAAAALVRDGKVISLTLPYDQHGPQPGGLRSNPQLLTTATGTDHVAGAPEYFSGDFGYSDDMIIMGTQCGTQWDALSHIFHPQQDVERLQRRRIRLAPRDPQRHPALERPHGAACRARRYARDAPAKPRSARTSSNARWPMPPEPAPIQLALCNRRTTTCLQCAVPSVFGRR